MAAMTFTAVLALLAVVGCGGSSSPYPDIRGCCRPDPSMNSCMVLGGYSPQGCAVTCDFFCSTNWRIETDSHGCRVWRYDTRSPLPGENLACFPQPDAGASNADAASD